jgi:hypothetical protein
MCTWVLKCLFHSGWGSHACCIACQSRPSWVEYHNSTCWGVPHCVVFSSPLLFHSVMRKSLTPGETVGKSIALRVLMFACLDVSQRDENRSVRIKRIQSALNILHESNFYWLRSIPKVFELYSISRRCFTCLPITVATWCKALFFNLRYPGVRKDILIKTGNRNRLNPEPALILALKKIRPRIEALACQKQAQSSH